MSALGIVVSEADPASMRIGEALQGLAGWDPAEGAAAGAGGSGPIATAEGAVSLTVDRRPLDCDRIVEPFRDAGHDPDRIVFASRHAGETGPLLTAHHTGNAGPADHGGDPETLATPAPAATRLALRALARHAPDGYDVAMECTHHGPTDVGAPSLFVEVGSGPDQWTDDAAAEAAARAILALRDVGRGGHQRRRTVAGFGGGHYAPRFGRIARQTPWAVGHVLADWCLDAMPAPDTQAGRTVLQAALRTSGADHALVTGEHPAVRRVVEDSGARVVSEAWLRAVGGAPLPLVDTVEDRLGPVGDSVQLGAPARPEEGASEPPDPAAVGSVSLPRELVEAARDVDRDAARAAVASHAVAFAVEDAGVGCEVAVADGVGGSHDQRSVVDRIHTGLIDVLKTGYDRVERTEDAVVVAREAFDPAAAAERGVPEGPAFGRLAAGESVTVDGRTVEPGAVHRVERRRLPLDPPETGEPKQK